MPRKALPWLRLYTEFSSDYKVQMMPEALQRRLIMLLCFQREGTLNSMGEDEICYRLGLSKKRWIETKKIFEERGFKNDDERIKNGDDFLKNFAVRQSESDDAAQRKRKSRKNAASRDVSHNLSHNVVTGQRCDMSRECLNLDIDTDKDKDKDLKKEKIKKEKKGKPAQSSPSLRKPPVDEISEKAEVTFIFDFWKQTMNHPKAILDQKRKESIDKALKLGFSVPELCDAIRGCSQTPHNMGKNDRGEIFDGLHVIFKEANQIERFIRNFKTPPTPKTKSNLMAEANDEVLNRWLAKGE